MVIKKIFPSLSIDVLYKSDLCLHKWKVLLHYDDRGKLEATRERLNEWLSSFIESRHVQLREC